MEDDTPQPKPTVIRSDSSSASSIDHSIHAPVPTRPGLPSRRSSGTMIVPRDSVEVGPIELEVGPNDVRAMSPRRSSQDLEVLGREARQELQRSVAMRRRCHAWQANSNQDTCTDMRKNYKTLLSRCLTGSRPSRKNITSSTTTTSFYRSILGT